MINEKVIKIQGYEFSGLQVELPQANLVMAVAKKGFIMCGYLNMETAEKFNQAAAMVTGIKTIEDLTDTNLVSVSSKAKSLGLKEGMPVKEALIKLA